MENIGRLELIIGPMYAGKSSELLRIANRYRSIGKRVLAINHVYNTRYGSNDQIITHDKRILADNCIATETLSDIHKIPQYVDADIILIEELQFFTNAYDFVVKAIDIDHKTVIAAGLDGDYRKQEFGDVLRLIPHADTVMKLTALCKSCGDGTPALFTKRIINSSDIKLVGGEESYQAVCRKHF